MVLSVLGDQPVIAQIPSYFSDPPFAGLYDENPFYQEADQADIGRSRRVFRRSEIDYDPRGGFQQSSMLGRHLLQAQQFHPVAKSRWEAVEDGVKSEILNELRSDYAGLDGIAENRFEFRRWPLSFYAEFDYYEIKLRQPAGDQSGYFLRKPGETVFLDGNSRALHAVNQRVGLKLEKTEIRDYLFYFCSSIEAEHGRFLIVDAVDDLTFEEEPDEDYLEAIRNAIQPPSFPKTRPAGGDGKEYSIDASVLYSDGLFRSTFVVSADGLVAMENDHEMFTHLPVVKDSDLAGTRLRLKPREEPDEAP